MSKKVLVTGASGLLGVAALGSGHAPIMAVSVGNVAYQTHRGASTSVLN